MYSTITKTTVYRASATILIQESRSASAPALGDIRASQELASTYRQLMGTSTLLQRVNDQLDLPDDVKGLRSRVSTSVRSGTPLLDVEVTGKDPDSPVEIANTLVQVFIQDRQTTRLSEIARLEALAAAQGTDTTALVEAQLSTLGSMNVVEEATLATPTIRPSVRKNMLLGGFLGIILGIVLAFLLDYLSNKIGSVEHVDRLFQGGERPPSPLGVVFQWPPRVAADRTLIVKSQPDSVYSELFRQVRTGFQFTTSNHQGKAFLVTSVVLPSLGKTTLVANLGAVLAQGGQKVIIVDGDLRRPEVHRYFGVENRSGGLTSVVANMEPVSSHLVETDIKGLRVLPSGPIPRNPADLASKLCQDVRNSR